MSEAMTDETSSSKFAYHDVIEWYVQAFRRKVGTDDKLLALSFRNYLMQQLERILSTTSLFDDDEWIRQRVAETCESLLSFDKTMLVEEYSDRFLEDLNQLSLEAFMLAKKSFKREDLIEEYTSGQFDPNEMIKRLNELAGYVKPHNRASANDFCTAGVRDCHLVMNPLLTCYSKRLRAIAALKGERFWQFRNTFTKRCLSWLLRTYGLDADSHVLEKSTYELMRSFYLDFKETWEPEGEIDITPEYLVPFSVTQNDAKALLQTHLGDTYRLRKTADLQMLSIRDVYVPCHLFDFRIAQNFIYLVSQLTASGSSAKRWYSVVQHAGFAKFEALPILASNSEEIGRYPWETMPFDTSGMRPTNEGDLTSNTRLKANLDEDDCLVKARDIAFEVLRDELVDHFRTDVVRIEDKLLWEMEGRYLGSTLCLLPVWLIVCSWKGQESTFLVNGSTGECLGVLQGARARSQSKKDDLTQNARHTMSFFDERGVVVTENWHSHWHETIARALRDLDKREAKQGLS